MRYVQPLTDGQRALLEQTMQEDPSFRARSRAHGLLLRAAGTTIKAIAKTSQVHRVTVSTWIKQWEPHGVQSLPDQPRSGRPSKLTPDEQAIAQPYIKEEPRSLQGVVERLAHKTEKRLSISTLKRLAKKARLRWKRVRKSLKKLRDPDAFAHCQRVSVNSFLDTFGPKIRLHQPRHTVAHVSPGRVLCIHAAQSARSHCIDAETRAAPVGGPPPYQRS